MAGAGLDARRIRDADAGPKDRYGRLAYIWAASKNLRVEPFKVRIEANELERQAIQQMPGGVYEKDGYLTDEALAEIRRPAPEIDPAQLVVGRRKGGITGPRTGGVFVGPGTGRVGRG